MFHEATPPFVSETLTSPVVAPLTSAMPEGVQVLPETESPIAPITQLVLLPTDMVIAPKLAAPLVFAKVRALPPIGTRLSPQSAVVRAPVPL